MSCEPGMCPQRLFTNTKLFMIAGKRNPTRAWSSPDLAGGAGAGAPRGGRLFFRSAPGEAAVRLGRGATGRRVRLGLRPRRLCLRGSEGPRPWQCSGLEGLGGPRFSLTTPCALLPSPSPIPLRFPQPGSRKTPSTKDIHFGS